MLRETLIVRFYFMLIVRPLATLLLLLLLSHGVYAAGKEASRYYKMQPDVVVNYGETGRLRYIRSEISLRASSAKAMQLISLHQASIRHNVLMFLAAQKPEVIKNPSAREDLRAQLLLKVQEVMTKLTGESCIDRLYFTNFIVQS